MSLSLHGGHLVGCLVGCPSGNQAGCHQTAQPASHSMTPKIGWCSAAACLFTSQHATALSHRAGPCFTLALPPIRVASSDTVLACLTLRPIVFSLRISQQSALLAPSRRHPAAEERHARLRRPSTAFLFSMPSSILSSIPLYLIQ